VDTRGFFPRGKADRS